MVPRSRKMLNRPPISGIPLSGGFFADDIRRGHAHPAPGQPRSVATPTVPLELAQLDGVKRDLVTNPSASPGRHQW
jgi:hypothetical protein